jgi:hypothetical protein
MSDMIEIIDRSIRDFAVSDDAMRWSPEPPSPPLNNPDTPASIMRAFAGRPDPGADEELRQAICRWLERNGIDYNSVPLDAKCVVMPGGCIVIDFYCRRDGKLCINRDTGEAAREVRRYRMRASPGPRVRAWLFADCSEGLAPPLAADGAAYRRRCLARRRRR